MALKKSELYSSLWQSCDELRGGMDASQYKDYVLVLLFVKYVSDRFPDLRVTLHLSQRSETLQIEVPLLLLHVVPKPYCIYGQSHLQICLNVFYLNAERCILPLH